MRGMQVDRDAWDAAPGDAATAMDWTGRAGGLLAATLAAVVVFAMLATLVGMPAARSATAALEVDWVPPDTGLPALEQRSVVYAADGSVLAVLHDEVDRRVVGLDDVPAHVRQAVLTAEDRRFYDHDGFDVEGIGRAVMVNLRAGGITQGGSTISQQLAKQNFLADEQTMERKLTELFSAIALEDAFSKDELLERYLNQVYFGGGAYGVAAAAEQLFGVDPAELTVSQAALLAGVIRSPGRLDPRSNPAGAKERRDRVLAAMATQGHLSTAEADAARDEPLDVLPAHEHEVDEPYVVEAVKREFFANPAFGETWEDRYRALFTGGLAIHTSLDPRLQDIAAEVVAEALPGPGGPTGAIAAVAPDTGRIQALHGGADFTAEQFDLATQGRRQPGSAFKPFVAAEALSQGFPLGLSLAGSGPLAISEPGRTQPWTVSNYGGASYGRVDLRAATARSVNTAFAHLIMMVGVDEVVALAERMGLDRERGIGTEIGPAIALGGLEFGVTPLEMAGAFAVFADEGVHRTPHIIDRVDDASGTQLHAHADDAEQVLVPGVNAAMVDVLQGVVRNGTGTAARLSGWQPLGKTGTTQENADAWFVGAVKPLAAAVWVGHPESRQRMPGMTGGGAPARIWQQFMHRALEGVAPVDFADDADLPAVEAAPVDVPDVVGLDETEAMMELAASKLVPAPRPTPSTKAAGTVLWQSPRAGAGARTGDDVTIGVSTGRPPPPPPEVDDDDGEADEADADESGDDEPDADEAAPPEPRPRPTLTPRPDRDDPPGPDSHD